MSFWDTTRGIETAEAIIAIAHRIEKGSRQKYEHTNDLPGYVKELSEKGYAIQQIVPDIDTNGTGYVLYH